MGDAWLVEIALTTASKHPSASSVLVVDDERASAELVAALLWSQGFQVRIASSGREGLEVLAAGGVDLLILDLMMAKLDGVEVCAHVRHDLRDPFLPIIITTSLHDRESRIRAKEAGADDVLVKPLDGLELLVRIDSLLRARTAAVSLIRERDRLRDELAEARTQLQCQERATRVTASASKTLRSLVEEQSHQIESVRKVWSHLPLLDEQLHRWAELTTELRQNVEYLHGTSRVALLPESAEPAHDLGDMRQVAARLAK
jgi:putative two-component system response regulator